MEGNIRKQKSPGAQPGRFQETPNYISNIPQQTLLCKPLKDHLNGLLRKVRLLDDCKVNQSIIDCILFVMIEAERIDGKEVA